MSLSSFFLHMILNTLAIYGYNPVTELENFNKLQEDYPKIAQLFKEKPKISRHINPMISNLLEKNCPTYFHRMFLLYYQYLDDAEIKEENYRNLRSFYLKDGSKQEKHLSKMTKILPFTMFFKIVYKYNREDLQKSILDKVTTLNIFTLKKESKKLSQGIKHYFSFKLKNDETNLELCLSDHESPLIYDLTKTNEIKRYFEIEDESQDTILLKMFWAAIQNIHPTSGIFGTNNDIFGVKSGKMNKHQVLNLFASILFCNKRKSDKILPNADDDDEDDDEDEDGDFEVDETNESE